MTYACVFIHLRAIVQRVHLDLTREVMYQVMAGMQRYKDVRELRTIFEEFGPLSDINVPINQMNNQPRGFAFVEYKRSTYADA